MTGVQLAKRNYRQKFQLDVTCLGVAGLSLLPKTFGQQIMIDCKSYHQIVACHACYALVV